MCIYICIYIYLARRSASQVQQEAESFGLEPDVRAALRGYGDAAAMRQPPDPGLHGRLRILELNKGRGVGVQEKRAEKNFCMASTIYHIQNIM